MQITLITLKCCHFKLKGKKNKNKPAKWNKYSWQKKKNCTQITWWAIAITIIILTDKVPYSRRSSIPSRLLINRRKWHGPIRSEIKPQSGLQCSNHLVRGESRAEHRTLDEGPLSRQMIGCGDRPSEEGKARSNTPHHCHVFEPQQWQQTLVPDLFQLWREPRKGRGQCEDDDESADLKARARRARLAEVVRLFPYYAF